MMTCMEDTKEDMKEDVVNDYNLMDSMEIVSLPSINSIETFSSSNLMSFRSLERNITQYDPPSDVPAIDKTDNMILIKRLPHFTPNWHKISIETLINDSGANNRLCDESLKQNKEELSLTIACDNIRDALKLRDKYTDVKIYGINGISYTDDKIKEMVSDTIHNKLKLNKNEQYKIKFGDDGIIHIYDKKNNNKEVFQVIPFKEYINDFNTIRGYMDNGPTKTLAHNRLKLLQSKFNLHEILNSNIEKEEVKDIPYRNFYNVRKVDNHIHHSASIHQKQLLSFIKEKCQNEEFKTEIVHYEPCNKSECHDCKNNLKCSQGDKTLEKVLQENNINISTLTVKKLDVNVTGRNLQQRFDKFKAKYDPCGVGALRKIFLRYDNKIKGKFLLELTHKLFNKLIKSKYKYLELRISIHGRDKNQWNTLSEWIINKNYPLYCSNIRWMIQIPRNYQILEKKYDIKNFNEVLDNIFEPLFDITLNPQKNYKLFTFMKMFIGFDSVDDESKDKSISEYPKPLQWSGKNPPYNYYMYYMWANITKLNKLRRELNLNTYSFRPHSGEAGPTSHLCSAFLVANSINHGIRLQNDRVLQYLYYLKQIGISVSPISNNALFKSFLANPFKHFFRNGLNVTLSTDDPLIFHFTDDSLMEEYSTAAKVWNLSRIDLCEIARNSVLQSGFSHKSKKEWLGSNYMKNGAKGNDIYRTNVPNVRLEFRNETLKDEIQFIESHGTVHNSNMRLNVNVPQSLLSKQLKSQKQENIKLKEEINRLKNKIKTANDINIVVTSCDCNL